MTLSTPRWRGRGSWSSLGESATESWSTVSRLLLGTDTNVIYGKYDDTVSTAELKSGQQIHRESTATIAFSTMRIECLHGD